MSAKSKPINIHVFQPDADNETVWCMDIKIGGITLQHERCERDYAAPGDAITSARHAVNELIREAQAFYAAKRN